MIRSKHVGAVMYLYYRGYVSPELACEGFVVAAEYDHVATVKFLFGTNTITEAAFHKGFQAAATTKRGSETMKFLYSLGRISPEAVSTAVLECCKLEGVAFLVENATIPDSAVNTVFTQSVTGSCPNNSIVEYLYRQSRITPERIGDAFVAAVNSNNKEVEGLLRDDDCISTQARSKAFETLVIHWDPKSAEAYFFKYEIAPESVLKAFEAAIAHDRNVMIKFLCDEDKVPQRIKHQMFVIAAREGQRWILEKLSESGDWPLEVLTDALRAATSSERDTKRAKRFLRKKICKLLVGV